MAKRLNSFILFGVWSKSHWMLGMCPKKFFRTVRSPGNCFGVCSCSKLSKRDDLVGCWRVETWSPDFSGTLLFYFLFKFKESLANFFQHTTFRFCVSQNWQTLLTGENQRKIRQQESIDWENARPSHIHRLRWQELNWSRR